ncbi:MAG TPA: capsid cement protein [Verrucomicrobiae bacterium]
MTTKTKMMKHALATLVAAARLRWLQGRLKNNRTRFANGSKGSRLRLAPATRARLRLARKPETVLLANIAEGTHEGGITKFADAAITERWLLAKVGSASDRIAVCGASDIPIGVISDEAAAVGDSVSVSLLGSSRGTVRMVASAAIVQGALLEPAASGRVATLGAGAGTHHVVGRALDAAGAAGDVIEVDPFYFLRVI